MTEPGVDGTPLDIERQVFVTLSLAFGVVGVLAGIGVIGAPVRELADGAFAPDFTLLAPARPAFWVWRLIYLGLFAFTVWQWTPRARDSQRVRSVGWLMGVSMILNAAWLLVSQRGLLWVDVALVVVLLVVLAVIATRLSRIPAQGTLEFAVLDVPVALYLGWVCVATPANVAAALVRDGLALTSPLREGVTIAVLVLLVMVVLLAMRRTLARFTFGIVVAWGLGWIAWGRLGESPYAPTVGIAAAVGAAVVLAGAITEEGRAGRYPRLGTHRAGD